MKARLGDVRKVVREEYLRGVPEFVFREATHRYVAEIRTHVKKFIMQNRSEDFIAQREAIDAMNDVLEKLEDDANNLLEDALFQYVQSV